MQHDRHIDATGHNMLLWLLYVIYIDLLYTLDSASCYSAIQKLKP